jgi:hypothetical protein
MQNLFSPLFEFEQKMIDSRTRFLLLGNYDDPSHAPPRHVQIFRGTRTNPPTEKVTDWPAGPNYRSLQGANPIPHPLKADEKWIYLGKEKLLPASSQRITQCLNLCAAAGMDVQDGAVSPFVFI